MSRFSQMFVLALLVATAAIPADAAKVAIANCSRKQMTYCAYNNTDFTQTVFDQSHSSLSNGEYAKLTCSTSSSCNIVALEGNKVCGQQGLNYVFKKELGNYSYQFQSDGTYTSVGNSSHTFDTPSNVCAQENGKSCSASNQCLSGRCLQNTCVPDNVTSFYTQCQPQAADVRLDWGQAIASCDKSYFLVMQGDNNLVLYNKGNTAAWATGTNGKGGEFALFQADGNFVVYKNGGRQASWASNTSGSGKIIVQNDGNIVIYGANGPFWSSNSFGK